MKKGKSLFDLDSTLFFYFGGTMLIGIFWLFWLFSGYVIPEIVFIWPFGWELPFGISRLYDLLVGPIFLIVTRWLVAVERKKADYMTIFDDSGVPVGREDIGFTSGLAKAGRRTLAFSFLIGCFFGAPYSLLALPAMFIVILALIAVSTALNCT